METRTSVADREAPPLGTVTQLFLQAVDRFGDETALREFVGESNELRDFSYREVLETATRVAAGLKQLGLEPGDRAAILSENRTEWALTDYGCMLARVVSVPIYDTLIPEQVGYILENSGARLVFASSAAQVAKVAQAVKERGLDLKVVCFDGGAPGAMDWDALLASANEGDCAAARAEAERVTPDDLLTVLYTSGTTGDPKGVMLTHNNLHSNVQACGHVLPIESGDVALSFLPLSHILQRMVDYLLLTRGCLLARAHTIKTVAEDFKIVRPTIEVSVPRLYEKVYNKVTEGSGLKKRLVDWAIAVGNRWADEKLAGRSPSGLLALQHGLADRLVFSKVRAGVGGRLKYFVSGGAPLAVDIARFFYAAGLPILEGYGLTETSPVTNVNRHDDIQLGTVGPPVPGTEIRIADDGEILVRGPQVMKGYFNDPEKTAEVINADGWFSTGDIGEITENNCLRITDRKKDLIVTAAGKNVAPQPIENRLKTNPFVEQLVMVGDRRKFCALLVVPSFENLNRWAKEQGVDSSDRRALLRDSRVHELMEREVMGQLGPLASFERPKKLALLEDEFTVEDGTLTPTQKVRRRVIQERFSTLIDEFYLDANEDRTVFNT